MKYLSNAFSLNMLKEEGTISILRKHITPGEVPSDALSIVGHADIASILTSMLGREVAMNRVSQRLNDGDELFVAQYIGPRLPEGATTLPEGARIEFYKLTLSEV